MIKLHDARGYADGFLDESSDEKEKEKSAEEELDDDEEEEIDEAFQECAQLGLPLLIQLSLMDECCGNLEEAVVRTYTDLTDYMIGQGYLNEAEAMSIVRASKSLNKGVKELGNSYPSVGGNKLSKVPRKSIIRMDEKAIKKRLKSLYVLYFGRKNNDRAYKKYKIGCAIKKQNKAALDKKYGNKAAKMAEKHYRMTKSGKFKATVSRNANYARQGSNKSKSSSRVR